MAAAFRRPHSFPSAKETCMSIQAALRHVTRYRYDRPITLEPQVIRLRPAPHCRANILSYALTIEPAQHFLNWQQDPQSNWQARVMIPEKTDHFTVQVDMTVDMEVINPFDFFLEPDAENFPFQYSAEQKAELEQRWEKLEQERRKFPDSSFAAFVRHLKTR